MTPHPLQDSASMDTNHSLSQRLTLTLNSDARDLDLPSAEWACHALGPKPNPTLSFLTSVLLILAHKPSQLEF